MALIDCYECGSQISSVAPTCPKCGAPAKAQASVPPVHHTQPVAQAASAKKERTVGVVLFLGLLFAPYVFFWFLFRDGHSYKSRVIGFIWLVIFLLSFVGRSVTDHNTQNAVPTPSSTATTVAPAQRQEARYPESGVTYEAVNAEIGCGSKYSDEKKEDIFNTKYRNQWMTWRGKIELLEQDEVSLNVDGLGTQDLQVDFADKKAGYDLVKGEKITVRFLMKSAGGCFLPFSGEQATLVR